MPGRHSKDGPALDETWAAAGAPEPARPAFPPPTSAPVQVPAHIQARVQAPVQAPVQAAVQATVPAPVPAAPVVDLSLTPAAFSAPVGTGSAAEAAPVLPAGSSARRAVREQKKRRSRRTRLLAGGLVAVLAAVAVLAGYRILLANSSAGTAAPAVAVRPQSTLLLEVVNGQRQTVAAVLLAHDTRSEGTGFGALVPSSLAVDASGSGAGTFGATSASGSADSSAATLSDVIGVTVDGTWVLDGAGLAALVDSVGGVDVDVDRDVTVTVAGGGTQTLAAAGHQHLTGAAAAAFATYLAAQEPEQSRLARFAEVLGALFPKLPADSAARASLLNGLGAHSTTTARPSTLDTFLGALRSDATGDRLAFDTLPTRSLDLGTGTPTLLLDPTAADAMLKNSFSGSLPAQRPDGAIRVVIQNGVGTPGLGAKARTKLVVAGITYVSGGNAGHFGYLHSLVLVPTGSGDAGVKQGQAVARALGLPISDVALTEQGQTIADIVVILGADFKA